GDPSREPIMTVDQVVGDVLVMRVVEYALGEFWQVVINSYRWQRAGWASRDVNHAHAGRFGYAYVRLARILVAGKNIHLETQLCHLARKLADVDVHAARFFAAQLGERAGMDAENGDTTGLAGHISDATAR